MPASHTRKPVDKVALHGEHDVERHPIPWLYLITGAVVGTLLLILLWLAIAPIEYVAPLFNLISQMVR